MNAHKNILKRPTTAVKVCRHFWYPLSHAGNVSVVFKSTWWERLSDSDSVIVIHAGPCLKKLCKIVFVRISSIFHKFWEFLAERWRRNYNYASCTHFPPHLIRVTALRRIVTK